MLNPYYGNEDSNSDNELVSIPGQSLSELATQMPTVVVENSTDIRIGPHLQYNGPVTVKQYITVNGKEEIKSSSDDVYHDIATSGLQPLDVIGKNVVLRDCTNEQLDSENQAWLRNRYVWSAVAVVLLVAIIVSLAVTLPGAEYETVTPIKTSKIQFLLEHDYVDVYEGYKSVQWFVNVKAPSKPKLVWYGPDCEVLEERDGPSSYKVYTSPDGKTTKLKINNISLKDRGLYRLQARTKDDEDWAYITLNVKSMKPLENQHVTMCYMAEWAYYRQGLGKFTIDDIVPTLCSHIVYAFAALNVNENSIESMIPEYDLEDNNGTGAYKKVTSLKEKYPHLKVLLGMGGWKERIEKNYSVVAESPTRRKAFVRSVSDFLRKYNFDGLDFHWQYPAEQHGVPADKMNFVHLLKELREEFDKFGWLLTAPLGVIPDTIEQSFDIPAISRYLDYMFAMCYSYHHHDEGQTGPNAPLYPLHPDDERNVESSISILLDKGVPRDKLVLALPMYGRIFKMNHAGEPVGFGVPAVEGQRGSYVQGDGMWGYNEICYEVDNPLSNWVKRWDNVTHTPYAYKDDQFMSYDNVASITEKVKLALKKKLAGVMIWSLDMDDFRGSCTFGKSGSAVYPLLRAINNALDPTMSWNKVPCNSSTVA